MVDMRRSIKKYKFLKVVFIISIFIMIIGISYSYLSTSLNISGDVSGSYSSPGFIIDEGSNPNLTHTRSNLIRSSQSNLYYYHYTFVLNNIGNTNYNSFKVTFTFNYNINVSSIPNHEYLLNNNVLIVQNISYDLKKGKSVQIDFTVSSSSPILNITKIKLEASTRIEGTDPSKFKIEFIKTSESGNYTYQYNVKLTNLTGKRITYWQLDITLPEGTSYVSGSNAIFTTNGNILTIKNNSSNGTLNNNASTTFVLQLSTNIINFIPTNIKVTIR
jgi:hypothetical protein